MEYEEEMRPEKGHMPNYMSELSGFTEPDIYEINNEDDSLNTLNEIENKKHGVIMIIF